MAGSRPRRGPAPIASFDHDVSDEVRQASSPETKQALQLPEIREHGGGATGPLLRAPAAPRIDISRASSSSHHDSRDSSPEMALFAGASDAAGDGGGGLGFREDGALELRSSTEELAFLEGAPGGPPPPPPPAPRRASRKDSQCSEAALLAVSGRTSRLSSVGSQCSAHSALSGLGRLSRLSVTSAASGASALSRSPSPHRMLLETSFCGPKPIETDPDACGAAVEERLLELAKLESPSAAPAPPADARDRREVRTEVTVERVPRSAPAIAPDPVPASAPPPGPAPVLSSPLVTPPPAPDKQRKEDTNSRARAEQRRARPKQRRDRTEPEVYNSKNRSKDIIRIKLKPDEEYDDDDNDEEEQGCSAGAARPSALVRSTSPRRSPSPGPVAGVSRKSSFCSLFKSRETIASPDSPLDALRRKKSLTEGRSRSKSRDRAVTPSSAGKIRGSVLSLFRVPRRSAASPSPSSRATSPGPPAAPPAPPASRADHLKYYEDARDGIIHIPLRTPSDDRPEEQSEKGIDNLPRASQAENRPRRRSAEPSEERGGGPRPASAPQPSRPPKRTVLPDGSIIIPLRSPTDSTAPGPGPEARRVTSPLEAPVEASLALRSPPVRPESQPEPQPSPPPPPVGGEQKHDPTPAAEAGRSRRKERLVFTTHVGSTEQVFTTQLSITKTPSVTSEISESFPSFPEDARPPVLRDTRIGASPTPSPEGLGGGSPGGAMGPAADTASGAEATEPGSAAGSLCGTPQSQSARDSSGSEASSGGTARGCETEARGLVVQESFEDELPYVPTTLPLERSLALPMVPVRDRAAARHATASVERPRASSTRLPAAPPAPVPPAPAPAAEARQADKLRIRLPRRPRAASSASSASALPDPPRPPRPRTRSGDGAACKPDWIDFEEVPERRKQPRRIQTLPATPREAQRDAAVVFSYVEPDECRCECHAQAASPSPDAEPAGVDGSPRGPGPP